MMKTPTYGTDYGRTVTVRSGGSPYEQVNGCTVQRGMRPAVTTDRSLRGIPCIRGRRKTDGEPADTVVRRRPNVEAGTR